MSSTQKQSSTVKIINPIFQIHVIEEETQQIQTNPYQQRIDIIDRFLSEIQTLKQMSFYRP